MSERNLEIAGELKGRLAEAVRLIDFRVFGSKSEKIVETITDVLVRYSIS